MYCTIIETCPKCGFDLIEEVIATYSPIYVKKCYKCGWSHEERSEIKRVPFIENSISDLEIKET